MMRRFYFGWVVLAAFGFMATACSLQDSPRLRHDVTKRLASASWMVERQIQAGDFTLAAFERMHERHDTANVYIEGDGMTWDEGGRLEWVKEKGPNWREDVAVSDNPTPVNPVAMHLATRDKAENVVYLGRPCQYLREAQMLSCDPAYWTNRRYSAEVVKAYEDALNEIARRYDIEGFNLIGYDGGGTIALLLAMRRPDILSVRTVAGNLDHKAHSRFHNLPIWNKSLNPPDFAARLRDMPQYHFYGGNDDQVPPMVIHSYLQALGPTPCVQHQFIQEATHDEGWVDKWPELLSRPVNCVRNRKAQVDYYDAYEDYEIPQPDYYTPPPAFPTSRERPVKP